MKPMRNSKLEGFRQIHDFIESMDDSIRCLHELKRQVGSRTVLTPINTSAFLTYIDTQLANLEEIRDGTVSRTAQMIGAVPNVRGCGSGCSTRMW
jgi:hypothetical protein